MNETAAFGATFLFAAQPVLWGHAFINPKDIPFLTFFLMTLLLGFRMADNLQPILLSKRTRLISTALWLIPFVILFFGSGLILPWIDSMVRSAAAGGTNIISLIASDVTTVEPEIYIQKYSNLYIQIGFFYLLLSTLALFFIFRRSFTPFLLAALAAVVLGFTVAIRNLGLFAGVIVILYALWKHGRNAFVHLLVYGVLTATSIYLFWPYLWTNPIGRLVGSLFVMSRYPWNGEVLFNGIEYVSTSLPTSYLPTLLGIQLTEPVWILFILGLAVAIIGLREKRDLLILLMIWFFIPLIGFMVMRTVLYDNFRQILFILPPIFIISGLAFEKIKRPLIQVVVIALCVLPGLIGIVKLYPYEYIYYNSFIGGVDGAAEKFEMDYWGTSFREAAEYVNTIAPEDANIWVEGPSHLFAIYARQDLRIFSTSEPERAEHYDYVVATTRYNLDRETYPDAKIIFRSTRGDAVLAVVKQP
jgi:hypothetical protein